MSKKDFKKELPDADIYVYDNNSTDGTDKIAENAGAIVRYEYEQGKGNVVRSMFRDIEADCYIMVDGDDTYPAEPALEFEKLILNGEADMVIVDYCHQHILRKMIVLFTILETNWFENS